MFDPSFIAFVLIFNLSIAAYLLRRQILDQRLLTKANAERARQLTGPSEPIEDAQPLERLETLDPHLPMPTRWFRSSPWRAIAEAEGWSCAPAFSKHASVGLRMHSPPSKDNFEANLRVNSESSLTVERLRIRRATRQPPNGTRIAGSTLTWKWGTAVLHPPQPWLPTGGPEQILVWKAGYLELQLVCPRKCSATLVDALALFDALRQAEFPAWYAPHPDWTLRMDSSGLWPRVSTQVDGQPVSASLEWANAALRSRVMAPLPPQDTRFCLVHAEHGEGDPVPLRHPIADSLLHGTGDAKAMQALLADPHTVQAILAVVHAYPGSRVTQDRVELRFPGDLGEALPAAIESVALAATAITRSRS